MREALNDHDARAGKIQTRRHRNSHTNTHISSDRGWRVRAPNRSVHKARCLYTRIVQRGKPGPRGGKGRTGSGAGSEPGAGTKTGRGVRAGTGTETVMGTGTEQKREQEKGWR